MSVRFSSRLLLVLAVAAVGLLAGLSLASDAPASRSVIAAVASGRSPRLAAPLLRGRSAGGAKHAGATKPGGATVTTAFRVSGRATAGDASAPLCGVVVQAWLRRGDVREALGGVRTGRDGRYALELEALTALPSFALRAGALEFRATAPDPTLAAETHLVRLTCVLGPKAFEHDFVFQRRAVAVGRVVDGRGRPVPDARVRASYTHGVSREEVRTDAEGRYALPAQSPPPPLIGPIHLHVGAEAQGVGTASVRGLAPPRGGRLLDVPDLVLEGTGVVAGQAVFPDGTPAAGLELEYRPMRRRGSTGPEPGLFYGRLRADPNGRFRLTGLQEGVHHVCALHPPAGAAVRTGTVDVRLVVPFHRVRVHVQDEAGRPLPGTLLCAQRLGPTEETVWGPRAVPTADGCVDVWASPGERIAFMAQLPGLAVAEAETTVHEDAWSEDVVLTLRPAGDDVGHLLMRPRLPDGVEVGRYYLEVISPLAGVAVRELSPAHVGEDGLVGPLPAGAWRLWMEPWPDVEGERGSFFDAETVATVRRGKIVEVGIDLRPGGRVRVRVTTEEGVRGDSPRVELTYSSKGEPQGWLAPEWDGWDTSEVLEPGLWELEVEAAGFEKQRREVQVIAGAVTDVEVVLRPVRR